MEGELINVCSPSTLLQCCIPYTKQLKSRSYIFCFCWQLLPSHQRLIRHFGCFISFVIFLMAFSFQAERHWDPPSLMAMPAGKSTPRIMVPLQVLPAVTVTADMHTLRGCVHCIFIERVHKKWQGSSFPCPALAVGMALAHCRVIYRLHTQPVLGWLQLAAWNPLDLHIADVPLQCMSLLLWEFLQTVPWKNPVWPLTAWSCPLGLALPSLRLFFCSTGIQNNCTAAFRMVQKLVPVFLRCHIPEITY